MTGKQASAVVVTFHPDAGVLGNLAAVRPQVACLIVVDNGSSEVELEPLRAAGRRLAFQLIENGDNLGIAAALNLGICRAIEAGHPWLLLFDQDSRVTEGFVETMIRGFTASPWGSRLGILVPRYTDLRSGMALPVSRARDGGLTHTITSGSLMRLDTWRVHGPFAEELFIDLVDDEYSLRLRRAGLVLDECGEAELLHAPGEPEHIGWGRWRLFKATHYGPARRYYQARNKMWTARRYARDFPGFCLSLFLDMAKDVLKILAVEQHKGRKLAAMLQGLGDGLRERMGQWRG